MLVLLSLFVGVAARSAGLFLAAETFGCEFEKPQTLALLGCQSEQWNKTGGFIDGVTRRLCMDASGNGGGKVMWWTGKPIPPPAATWSVRAGDGEPGRDATSYTPGGYVSIYVRALKFDAMYKGLLMYAKPAGAQANASKVGNWIVPYEAAPIFGDDTRHICNRSVMHLSAEDKPYVVKFTFVAPPVGTGAIVIRTMLKTGPPNPTDYGSFYIMPNLTLTEAALEPVDGKFYPLAIGQSCSAFCQNHSLAGCSDGTLNSNLDGLAPFDTTFPCHGALFHDCTGGPRGDNNASHFCYYRNQTCPTATASCAATSDASTTLFCACGGIVSPAPRAIPGFITAALVLMSTWVMGRFRLGGVLLLGLLFAVTPAQAHNWIEGTRGRAALLGASQFCTPTFPQLNRNEIHMQVGVGQNFTVEWAAAHTDYTYFVIIHDSDRDKVSMLSRSFMDSWLSMCKTSNAANDTTQPYTKVHRFNMNFNLSSTEPVLGGAMPPTPTYGDVFRPNAIISGPIWDAFGGDRSMLFYRPGTSGVGGYAATQSGMYNDLYVLPFNNTGKPNTILAQYKDLYMMNDRRCESSNHNATWIETIARFSHQEVGRAVSAALLRIQAKKGPGRYQVHYRWASYCDVMDVDVRSTAVANPYGTARNNTAGYQNPFNEGHHCLFETPTYSGQCIEVVTDTQQCQAICNNDGNCKGYQLIPLQLDPASSGDRWGQFSGETFIPWLGGNNYNRSRCNRTQFENKNIPALGAMICYPIIQFTDDFNAARPLWSFTADMDHQGFYGTCYLRPRAVDFLAFTDLAEAQDVQYRFLDKCIPCDNIGQDLRTPRWGPKQNYCTDCTKYPSPAKQLAIPTWTNVGAGTFQGPVKWLSPGGSPFATADECKLLALRDPTCSKYVMHSENRTVSLLRNFNYQLGTAPLWINGGGYYARYFNWTSATNSPYYRTCGCLTGTSNSTPALDATHYKWACDGLANNTCSTRGFAVYRLP